MDVSIKTTEPMTVAYISKKGSFDLISGTMGQLFGWIGEKGFIPAGPVTGVYFSDPAQVPADELVWELRAPIAGEVKPIPPDASGVGVKQTDAMEVAATLYKGPYEEVGAAYGTLVGWLAQNGYQVIGPAEEVYLNDPQSTPSAELLTEVRFPVQKQ